MSDKAIVATAALKGACMAAIIVAVAETTFIQGLITAVCSAAVSGTFLLVSTRMTSKRTEEKVEGVKKDVLKGQEELKQAVKDGPDEK